MSINLLHLLLLIIIANGAPVVLRALMKNRLNLPVDFCRRLADDNPLFGKSKTWRGIAGALIFTSVGAVLLGYPAVTGILVALYVVAGDIFSSFIKRRLGMAPSSMAPLLDQVPESLFPAIMLRDVFELNMESIIILVCAFVISELLLSYIFYKLGIRKKPY